MTAPASSGPSPVGGGPAVSLAAVRTLPRRPKDPRTYVTARELDVLRLAANGATNRAIGSALGVGVEAVSSRMQSVFRKLRVVDRAQAVAVALRLGLLDLADVAVPEGANRGYGHPTKTTDGNGHLRHAHRRETPASCADPKENTV